MKMYIDSTNKLLSILLIHRRGADLIGIELVFDVIVSIVAVLCRSNLIIAFKDRKQVSIKMLLHMPAFGTERRFFVSNCTLTVN
jgi:hypothetical protein